ncbi:MAG: HNH endonuclease [Kofleriaceae bacterium]
MKERARRLGLDVSHFKRWDQPTRWTDEELRVAVASAQSFAQVMRLLGLQPAGGNYEVVQRRITGLALDTSHFIGQSWNRGLKFRPNNARPLATLLVRGSTIGSHALKLRLIREGLKSACCELCGWAERALDGRVPIELDHINGDRTDNRLENLRVLCPNCHSLQPTHRGLNKRSRR